MLDLGPYLRLLLAAAFLVFTVVGGISVYAFLTLQPGVHWRGKAVWILGAAIVGLSIMTVAGTVVLHFARLAGL